MIAYADTGATQSGSLGGLLIPLLIMGFFMYFFVIRPQKKRQQEVMDMRKSLKSGDKVILYSGLIGTIVEVDDENETMILEIKPNNTLLSFKTWSIRQTLNEDEDSYDEQEQTEDEE